MEKYYPYHNNPNSVKNWLSSHMALQYNWEMFRDTLLISILAIGLFYVQFSSLSKIQNLIFHSIIFILAIFSIILLIFKNKPIFIPFDKLENFKRKEVYILGQEIVWIIYFMLNHRESTLDNKIKESLSSPINLLENMDNQELAQEAYWLIEEEGGLTPRVVEPLAIAVIAMTILSQWFFVKCLVDSSGTLIYEPSWLKWFLDWLMSNHISFIPFTSHEKGIVGLVLDDSEYLNQLKSLQDVINFDIFRSAVLFYFLTIINVTITLFYLFNFFYYRRIIISYDKIIPRYNDKKLLRYIGIFFVYLTCFALTICTVILINFLALPSVEMNSILPFFISILMQTFFFLLTFYSISDFFINIYNRFFNHA